MKFVALLVSEQQSKDDDFMSRLEKEEVSVGEKAGTLTWKRKRLYVHFHHEETGLSVLSPHKVEDLSSKGSGNHPSIFASSLPPPIDTYVYPSPILVGVRRKEGHRGWRNAEREEISSMLESYRDVEKTDTVLYDVPAQPFLPPDSILEEEDYDSEEEYGRSDAETDEEEEWDTDEEEEVVPPPPEGKDLID